MNTRIAMGASAICLFALAPHQADRVDAASAHAVVYEYTLKPVTVAETIPAERIWMLTSDHPQQRSADEEAWKSLDSPALRLWVSGLPPGSIIRYTASSLPILGKMRDPDEGVYGFAKFCRGRGLQFGFNPVL